MTDRPSPTELEALKQRVAELEQELSRVRKQRDAVIAQVLPVAQDEQDPPRKRTMILAAMVGALLLILVWLMAQVLPRVTSALNDNRLPDWVHVRPPSESPR